MPTNSREVDPSRVVKIVCHELPTHHATGEGDYDLRWADSPKEVAHHDVLSLSRELTKLMPGREDDILSRLQNFKAAYLNLATGEVTS